MKTEIVSSTVVKTKSGPFVHVWNGEAEVCTNCYAVVTIETDGDNGFQSVDVETAYAMNPGNGIWVDGSKIKVLNGDTLPDVDGIDNAIEEAIQEYQDQ